jgi:hypothetical protein
MWLEGIAVVVMFVSCCGSICTIGTTSPHESEVHGLEESRNELKESPNRPESEDSLYSSRSVCAAYE